MTCFGKKVKLLTVGSALLLLGLIWLGQAFYWQAPSPELVKSVYFWTRSEHVPDGQLSRSENRKREIAEIRQLPPQAVSVLRRELHCDPTYDRIFESIMLKAPRMGRFLPKPELSSYLIAAPVVRTRAASTLGCIGPSARAAIPDLLKQIADPDPYVRSATATAIGRIGVNTPGVRRVLTRAANDANTRVSLAAAVSLWRLDGQNSQARDRIGSILKTNQQPNAIWCLRYVGPEAGRPLVPLIQKVLSDMRWSHFRMELVELLWELTGDKDLILGELGTIKMAMSTQSCDQAIQCGVKYELAEVPEFRSALRPLLLELASKRAPSSSSSFAEHWTVT